MKIAAGILLIFVAMTNLVYGFQYGVIGFTKTFFGAVGEHVADGLGDAIDANMEEMEGDADLEKAKEDMAELSDDATAMKKEGKSKMFYGFFMLVLGVLEIVAGVVLFVGTAAIFIRVTAGLEIANGIIAAAVFSSFGFTNALGLVAAVLALIASREIGASASEGGGTWDAYPPAALG